MHQKEIQSNIPSTGPSHQPTSNIIFNLAQMGIPLKDAFFIEIDTYFELLDLFRESLSGGSGPRKATQADIDKFLF